MYGAEHLRVRAEQCLEVARVVSDAEESERLCVLANWLKREADRIESEDQLPKADRPVLNPNQTPEDK